MSCVGGCRDEVLVITNTQVKGKEIPLAGLTSKKMNQKGLFKAITT